VWGLMGWEQGLVGTVKDGFQVYGLDGDELSSPCSSHASALT